MILTDVRYQVPVTRRELLGGTPRDHFDQQSQPADSYGPTLPQRVWREQPVLGADGKPQMEDRQEHIEARAFSPVARFLGVGAVAGFAGATLGLMGGLVSGHPGLGLALGAGFLGLGAGTLGAASAWGDQVSLQWDRHDITQFQMSGFHETVQAGTLQGESGYFHRFEPELKTTTLGSYQTPRVVHTKESR